MAPAPVAETEIELKLSIAPEHAAAVWRSPALSALVRRKPAQRKLFSAYYDSPEFFLRDHGVALRLRRDGRQWIQTLKGGGSVVGGLHTRIEHETILPAQILSFPAIIAAGAADLIDDDALRRSITVVFTTEFSRTAAIVEPAPGESIEVSVDRGVIAAGQRRETLCEIELELKQGDPRCLFSLAEALTAQLPVRVDNLSKAERGYRLAAGTRAGPVKAAAIKLDSEAGVDAAFCAIVTACLQHLQANERGVLAGRNAEYLHQARVALRRLRTAFSVFSRAIPREAVATEIERLRAIGITLGEARDWDVFTDEFLHDALPDLHDDAAAAALRRRAVALRARARRRARELLASREYSLALLKLAETLYTMSWREHRQQAQAETAALPLRSFARKLLDRNAKKLRKLGQEADRNEPAQLHALRIRAKKLRYAGEFLSDLYSRKAARAYLSRLESLQAVLGRLNDHATAKRLLEILARPQADAEDQRVLTFLRGYLAGRRQADLALLADAWQRAEAAKPFW